MTEIVFVVEEPVHPAGRLQVKVKGGVPPATPAVHVNAWPDIWPVPQLRLIDTGDPATVTVLDAEALLTLLPSLATTLIVTLPFDEHVM